MIDIISKHCIGSQEELAQQLHKRGYDVTQATLSRDLKMLRTTKVPTDRGTYMYVLPSETLPKERGGNKTLGHEHLNYRSGFLSLEFSGNIVVIKTRNGYASGIAYDIDMSQFPEILGTIPGSDTIFAVLREDVSRERAVEIFSTILPYKHPLI